MTDIKTGPVKAGQKYVDRAVYARPTKLFSPLCDAIAEIHGHVAHVPVSGRAMMQRVRTDVPNPILLGYQRTFLNWIKP